MNWKKLGLSFLLCAMLLMLIPVSAAWAQCPPRNKIFYKKAPTDNSAVRGSKKNPAANKAEALNICGECSTTMRLYKWNATQAKWVSKPSCGGSINDPTGVPLAQVVLIVALGLLAVGLLVWAIYLRLRLRRLEGDG